jgi:molecular chaperone GrpE
MADGKAGDKPQGQESPGEGAPVEPNLEELQAELTELRELADKSRDLHLRAEAELRNFRRRTNEERMQQTQYANQELLAALVTVADHLEMAVQAQQEGQDPGQCMLGVRMTYQQMMDLLRQFGLEPIEAQGFFDPALHEAVERVETDGEPCEGTIVGQVRKGFRLHDRVIRPAQVRVAVGARER